MQPFSLLLSLGTLAGLLLAGWRAPKKETIRYIDAAVFALFVALVGGRAAAVAVNWAYYAGQPGEIFQVWQGGLSGIGALAGAVAAVFILSVVWKFPAGTLAETLFPLAGTLSLTSWLGCGAASCSYGFPSTSWWAVPGKDEWGVMTNRIPVQLIGAVLSLLILLLVDYASRRTTIAGLSASLGLFGLSGVIFALSYLRADPVPIWQGLRLEAWGAIGLMAVSAALVVVLLVRRRFQPSSSPARKAL